jgi:hypothetical protein
MPLLDSEPTTTPSVASGWGGVAATSFVPGVWAAEPSRVSISADGGPSWIGGLEARLNELLELPGNWDTYGALPINVEHVVSGVKLLAHLVDDASPAPSVVPTVGRGIQFDWDMTNHAIEIRIDDTGATALIEGPDRELEGPIMGDLLVKARDLLASHTLIA